MFSAVKGGLHSVTRSSLLRLTALLSVIFAVAMLANMAATYFLVRSQIIAQIDNDLAATAVAIDAGDYDDSASLRIVADIALRPNVLRWSFSETARQGFHTVPLRRDHGSIWRVLLMQLEDGDWLAVGQSIEDQEDAFEALLQVSFWTTGVALASVIALGLWLAVLAQRRLTRIGATLGELARGNLKARTGNATNVTDLDILARDVDQTAEKLETLVQQTRNLGANIAHDLRTPLALLRANLEQAEAGEAGALDRAAEEAGRMSEIFDAIMRIARVEAGTGTDSFSRVSLGDLVREVGEIFAPVVEDSGKTLDIRTSNEVILQADKRLLIQVLANLLQNAITYGGDSLTLFSQGDEIGVTDNGEGVPEEAIERIVQPMVRLDYTRQSEGAGLGLAMVRAVADRHEARLVVRNESPRGFTVLIKFTNL